MSGDFASMVSDLIANEEDATPIMETGPKGICCENQPRPAPKDDDGVYGDGFTFSEWQPSDADVDAAKEQNRANIIAAASGDLLTVTASDPLVIVGKGHHPFAAEYIEGQLGFETGSVKVAKGGAFGPSLEVTGIIGWEDLVKDHLAARSIKRVSFS